MTKTAAEILSERDLSWSILHFEVRLHSEEVKDFRRFINRFVGGEDDRFHNHRFAGGYHYRYPVVQYKSVENRAMLMGVGEPGRDALTRLLENPDFVAQCNRYPQGILLREEVREVLHLHPELSENFKIRDYIALNDENIREWHHLANRAARRQLLERCLVGHIFKFASAIRWQLPPRSLQVEILDFDFSEKGPLRHPSHFLSFELDFRSNIELPLHIGLGKSVSHGSGVVFQKLGC